MYFRILISNITFFEYFSSIQLFVNLSTNHSYKLDSSHVNYFSVQDPDKFIPERWAPENPEAEILKELYFPFSLGKRNCVGQNLASLQTKIVLASVFKSFRFELQSPVEADYFLTLKAVAAVRVYDANKI